MNKIKVSKILPLLPPLLLALVIFVFSSFPAEGSDAQSGFFVDTIMLVLPSVTNTHIITTIVRKTAHFTEYALLGFFVARAFYAYDKKMIWSVATCIVYAITDEIHQMFVPGRSCKITDVLIDTAGIVFGTFVYCFGLKIKNSRKEKR